MSRTAALVLVASLVLACAAAPPVADPKSATVWGELKLVPREGVHPGGSGGVYGDRRLRDAELVDYSTPGFAVIYLDGEADASVPPVVIRIEDGPLRATLSPLLAAQRLGGRVVIENRTGTRHAISAPDARVLTQIDPGARVPIDLPENGEVGIFLLDVPSAESRVFVAPGPYAVVSRSGRYELGGLPAGEARLHAWHPRFPPIAHDALLVRGAVTRVDLEMGVSFGEAESGEEADVAQ